MLKPRRKSNSACRVSGRPAGSESRRPARLCLSSGSESAAGLRGCAGSESAAGLRGCAGSESAAGLRGCICGPVPSQRPSELAAGAVQSQRPPTCWSRCLPPSLPSTPPAALPIEPSSRPRHSLPACRCRHGSPNPGRQARDDYTAGLRLLMARGTANGAAAVSESDSEPEPRCGPRFQWRHFRVTGRTSTSMRRDRLWCRFFES